MCHPEATFSSTSITSGGDGEGITHTVTGDLTLHGVTQSISFPAALQVGPGGARAKAEFTIDRQLFGVSFPGRPDDLIKDDVLIKLELFFS